MMTMWKNYFFCVENFPKCKYLPGNIFKLCDNESVFFISLFKLSKCQCLFFNRTPKNNSNIQIIISVSLTINVGNFMLFSLKSFKFFKYRYKMS